MSPRHNRLSRSDSYSRSHTQSILTNVNLIAKYAHVNVIAKCAYTIMFAPSQSKVLKGLFATAILCRKNPLAALLAPRQILFGSMTVLVSFYVTGTIVPKTVGIDQALTACTARGIGVTACTQRGIGVTVRRRAVRVIFIYLEVGCVCV